MSQFEFITSTDAGGVVYTRQLCRFYERARAGLSRHHHFSQQVLLWRAVKTLCGAQDDAGAPLTCAARLDDMLEVQTEITSMRGTAFGFHATHCQRRERSTTKAVLIVLR